MMKALRNILASALITCVLVAGAQAQAFGQGKGDQKKDPPKESKVVPKEPKEPKNPEPRNTQPPKSNDNKKPPFFF